MVGVKLDVGSWMLEKGGFLLEIFQYAYMNKAFLIGIMIGVICPVTGIFIVLRRMSMIADALSHLSLAGVAAGLLAGAHPVLTASLFSVAGAVFIEKLRERYKSYSELSIAILLSAGLALGAVLLSMGHGFNANVFSYLFGSIVVTGKFDFLIIAGIGVCVLTFVFLIFKELYYISFDEEAALASGIPVRTINILFTVLTSLAIAFSMRIIGILLVSSLMIIPVATALQLAKSFKSALYYSVLFGQAAVISGLFASFYLDLAAGGITILISIFLLIAVIAVKAALAGGVDHKTSGEAVDT